MNVLQALEILPEGAADADSPDVQGTEASFLKEQVKRSVLKLRPCIFLILAW
jgi:hypothetical protein